MAPGDEDILPQLDGHGDERPTREELEKHSARTGEHLAADWWEVRDGEVRLMRMPREGEALPEIQGQAPMRDHVGGGYILPVRGPNGELLSYGHSTEGLNAS